MALNTSKCNHLMPLPFKGLTMAEAWQADEWCRWRTTSTKNCQLERSSATSSQTRASLISTRRSSSANCASAFCVVEWPGSVWTRSPECWRPAAGWTARHCVVLHHHHPHHRHQHQEDFVFYAWTSQFNRCSSFASYASSSTYRTLTTTPHSQCTAPKYRIRLCMLFSPMNNTHFYLSVSVL